MKLASRASRSRVAACSRPVLGPVEGERAGAPERGQGRQAAGLPGSARSPPSPGPGSRWKGRPAPGGRPGRADRRPSRRRSGPAPRRSGSRPRPGRGARRARRRARSRRAGRAAESAPSCAAELEPSERLRQRKPAPAMAATTCSSRVWGSRPFMARSSRPAAAKRCLMPSSSSRNQLRSSERFSSSKSTKRAPRSPTSSSSSSSTELHAPPSIGQAPRPRQPASSSCSAAGSRGWPPPPPAGSGLAGAGAARPAAAARPGRRRRAG